ncbi:MAG TPA: peptidylprolyl isomerase, partial [Anaerolineales bacterium]|nr:peptidylprolyl isomerase [Anaerolineales bacterium]
PSPSETPTELPTPTNTPIPLALTVNGAVITQAEYEASLARLLAVQPDLPLEEARARVLDEFIDQILLSYAAAQAGFIVDQPMLDERIRNLTTPEALTAWMETNGYTLELFQLELSRAIAAAWMRDQIIAGVPTTAEQVHARQILLLTEAEANSVYDQIKGGVQFDVMAAYYDPISRGDLGWFPRGFLTETTLEDAAFSLEPGNYSGVIATSLGYHIIELVERQPDRPLDPAVLQAFQEKAVLDWLAQQRTTSEITILIP